MSFKIFLGSIPGDVDSSELLEMLRKHTDVVRLKLEYQKKNNKKVCKGYGFAVLESRNDVDRLLGKQEDLFFKDRLVSVREFQSGNDLKENRFEFNARRIFVGNVPQSVDENGVKDFFSKYGAIENIYFVKKNEDNDTKYGYIVFKSSSSAQDILSISSPFILEKNILRVEEFGGRRSNQQNKKSNDEQKREIDSIQKPAHNRERQECSNPILVHRNKNLQPKAYKKDEEPEFFERGKDYNEGKSKSVIISDILISQDPSISSINKNPQSESQKSQIRSQHPLPRTSDCTKSSKAKTTIKDMDKDQHIRPKERPSSSSKRWSQIIRNVHQNHTAANLKMLFSYRPCSYSYI